MTEAEQKLCVEVKTPMGVSSMEVEKGPGQLTMATRNNAGLDILSTLEELGFTPRLFVGGDMFLMDTPKRISLPNSTGQPKRYLG